MPLNLILAQKIEPGRYVSVVKYNHITGETVYNGEFTEELIILDSINFIYKLRGDLDFEIGFGKYFLKNKFINLKFSEKPDYYDTNWFKIKDSIETTNDSIAIQFKITNGEQYLEGTRIDLTKENKLIKKHKCDVNGETILYIKNSDIPAVINVSYIRYIPLKFSIKNLYNKNIYINMSEVYNIVIENSYKTYSIKDVDLDGFYLKGGIFSEWKFFKRED